jgi:LysR family cys regulon transcriptional activator
MNFQQLRSIRETARRGYNLTEVANALFTSQPGVSRQIRELEDELGVVIFERNGKRLTGMTEPGKGILKIIDRLLVEAENLQQASLDYAGQNSGTLTIAATHTQARYALPKVVQSFRIISPNGSCRARPTSASPLKACRNSPTWCLFRATAGAT